MSEETPPLVVFRCKVCGASGMGVGVVWRTHGRLAFRLSIRHVEGCEAYAKAMRTGVYDGSTLDGTVDVSGGETMATDREPMRPEDVPDARELAKDLRALLVSSTPEERADFVEIAGPAIAEALLDYARLREAFKP